MSLEKITDPYLGGHSQLNCSDKTATEIEEEVKVLLKEKYEAAKQLIQENRDKLDKIAEFLYDKETITGKEFMEIFNQFSEEEKIENEREDSSTEDKES